jgi:hypothetical protein
MDTFTPHNQKHKPLVVLDEIQKYPRWKNYLKGLFDTYRTQADFLVTGSGRLDIYQRGGDSLLGRYHQYRLHPFSVSEILGNSADLDYACEKTVATMQKKKHSSRREQEAFEQLYVFGGFPEPFVKQSHRNLNLWHKERRNLIIREEMRTLTRIQLLSQVEHLVELLELRVASLLSVNSLSSDIQASYQSIKLWIDYLERLYYLYRLRPYSHKVQRSLSREPKLYFWDWSGLADAGARFENIIASHLLKWCHFNQDWGLENLELYFVRDKEKREVDFLVTKNKVPWLLVEAKSGSKTVEKSIGYFAEQLKVKHCFQVVKGPLEQNGTSSGISVVDAPSFLGALPV